ncbi:hypothetical protein VTN02DRAFT_5969 [Thermoascus thermophilus]
MDVESTHEPGKQQLQSELGGRLLDPSPGFHTCRKPRRGRADLLQVSLDTVDTTPAGSEALVSIKMVLLASGRPVARKRDSSSTPRPGLVTVIAAVDHSERGCGFHGTSRNTQEYGINVRDSLLYWPIETVSSFDCSLPIMCGPTNGFTHTTAVIIRPRKSVPRRVPDTGPSGFTISKQSLAWPLLKFCLPVEPHRPP